VEVIVGLSGGVDSSVAALKLKRQGVAIAGLFMRNWDDDVGDSECQADRDALDARKVALALDIPLYQRNFAREYWREVFEHFLAEHRRGRTPNPDILCNREIKFKTFLEHALALGATQIATGHYARIDKRDGRYRLLRAVDANKDQSYFLYALGQAALKATRFPIGHLEKPAVRALATEAGFATARKKDSTGICFIGERDFPAFLARYLPAQPGPIVDPDGAVLGEHSGLMNYTLGQRGGLKIGGRRGGSGEPWYVIGKRLESRELIVGQGAQLALVESRQLRASQLDFTIGYAPPVGARLTAKTRYRQPDQACTVTFSDADRLDLRFDAPQRAVTPGQSVVLYDFDECLGGAVIDATDAAFDPQRIA
jgi:tRNA-uridine 2-sulfurtransferase